MNKLEKAAVISVIANALIAIVKFFAGSWFGSIALVADAFHSFTDVIGSTAVFFGIKLSKIKSKEFPYGLYKLENLISLFVSLLIFYASFEIFSQSITALSCVNCSVANIGVIAIFAAIFSLVISIVLFKYKEKIGNEENSPSMIAEAKHTETDALSTVGVIIALIFSWVGFPFFDSLVGLVIAVLVFKAGFEILVSSSKVLLDASLDYKTLKKIEKIIKKQKGFELLNLNARSSGKYIFVEMQVATKIKDLKKVTLLHKSCEKEIKKAIPRIDTILIDVEYQQKKIIKYAVPLIENKENSEIAEGFGAAPFFALLYLTNSEKQKLIKTEFVKNPYSLAKSKKGVLVAGLLAKKKVDVLLNKVEMAEGGAYYALSEHYIEIEITNKNNLKEVLEDFK